MSLTAAAIYPDWPRYAARLRDSVTGLTDEQLALRAGPEHGTIWQLASHVAGARTFWLCGVFGEPGAEATPWTSPLTNDGWEDDESRPRSGQELAWALDSTWEVIRGCLERWSLDDLMVTRDRRRPNGELQTMSRASVLNRVISHDAYHAGEISQVLGVHGLPSADLWARPVTE